MGMRLDDSEVEELLAEWGGYVRTYRQMQGVLHRNTACLVEQYDAAMTRAPGEASNPVLANIIAEDRALLRVPAAVDAIVGTYPHEWRLLCVMRYVGKPFRNNDRVLLLPMQWSEIESKMKLPPRDREAAMRMLRRQLRQDILATLPHPAMWRWIDSHRAGE